MEVRRHVNRVLGPHRKRHRDWCKKNEVAMERIWETILFPPSGDAQHLVHVMELITLPSDMWDAALSALIRIEGE